jgi:peptidoglycan L-alanyl-D-glutamate endopeptidase CwlK
MGVISAMTKLDPQARVKLENFLGELTRWGLKHRVTETLRTQEVQEAYFAQGREPLDVVNTKRKTAGLPPISSGENQRTITNADGVKFPSSHQSGKAVDLFPLNINGGIWWGFTPQDQVWLALMQLIGAVAKKHGLIWGGDWKKDPKDLIGWDPWHVEVP